MAQLAEIQQTLKSVHSKIKPLPPRGDTDGMVRLSGIVTEAFQFPPRDGKIKSRATVLILSPTASEPRSMKRQSGTPPQLVAEVDRENDFIRVFPRRSTKYFDTIVAYENIGVVVGGTKKDYDVVIQRNTLLYVEFEGQAPHLGNVIEFFYGLSMWVPPITEQRKKNGASVGCFANGKNPKVLLEREDAVLVTLLLRAGSSLCPVRMPTFDELCASNEFDPSEDRDKEVYSNEKFILPITGDATRDRVAAQFALSEPGIAMRLAPRDEDDKSFSYAPGGTKEEALRRTALRFGANLSMWPSADRMNAAHMKNYQLTGGVYDLARSFYFGNVLAWKKLYKHFTGVEGFLAFGILLGQTGQTTAEDVSVHEAYAISAYTMFADVPTVLLRDGLPLSHRFVQHAFAQHKIMSADCPTGSPLSASKAVINLTEMDPPKRATFLSSEGSKHWVYRAFTEMEVPSRVLDMQVKLAKECEFQLDADGKRQPLCEALLDAEWDGDAAAFHERTYGSDVPQSDSSAFYRADHPFLQNQMLSMATRVTGRSQPLIYVFAINVGLLMRIDELHYGKFVTPSVEARAIPGNFRLPPVEASTDGPPTITNGEVGEKRALENGDADEPAAKRSPANGHTTSPVQQPETASEENPFD